MKSDKYLSAFVYVGFTMEDLEIAKKILYEESLTLVIIKNSEVLFKSRAHGISGLLNALENFGANLKDASAADRIVGKAIALLYTYVGVRAVYASILSAGAKAILEKHNVHFEYDEFVEKILDPDKGESCPFEKAATNTSDPEEAYRVFRQLQKYLAQTSEKNKELERIKEKKMKELFRNLEGKRKMSGKVVHVTDSNFNEVIGKNPFVLIDFWAEWCMPCRMMAPIVEDLAREYAGKILVGKLNVDENHATAERFQVFSIPTLIIMKNGEEVDRIVGYVPKSQIEIYLNRHLE